MILINKKKVCKTYNTSQTVKMDVLLYMRKIRNIESVETKTKTKNHCLQKLFYFNAQFNFSYRHDELIELKLTETNNSWTTVNNANEFK